MTRDDYDERRRLLEERLRADIAMIHAAHEVRVRALDTLWQESMGGDVSISTTVPSSAVRQPPAVPTAPPVPARPRGAVLIDLVNALPRLPNVFDKRDIARVLGYTASRSTLFRALERLLDEGYIAIKDASDGGVLALYRKVTKPLS
jgi:CRP-like cAMP-binding protein